ncbi:hypothetical protein F2P81_022373 [Scophthalmus maximus]|uniref:RING-type domain-containing protein n=1 Tax=Scophthalmus maximus TaxID=52904 RepID=A0A6A4S2D7_SCOMX|nr:hypothetical protein F2P81_022373 [Scophthalmus maximus]
MSGSWERLEEELLCPICLSVFTEPVQLPCSHSFCRACISSWVAGRAAVRCPECNRGYERAPPLQANVNLARFVERFNALSAERAAAEEPGPGGQGPPAAPRRARWRCEGPRGEAEEPGPGGQGPPAAPRRARWRCEGPRGEAEEPGPGGQGPPAAPRRARWRCEGPRGEAEEPGPGGQGPPAAPRRARWRCEGPRGEAEEPGPGGQGPPAAPRRARWRCEGPRGEAEEPGPGGQGPPAAPRRARWRCEGPRGEAEEPGPGGQGPPPGPGGQGPLPAPRRVRRRSEGPRGDAEEPGPGTRPIHERGQKSACSTVCEVERQHVHMQDMLLRQQDRLVGHLKDIDEQLTKLEANKTQMKDTKQYHLLMYRSGCHLIGAKPRLGLDGLNPDHLLSHLPTEEKNLQIVLENPLTEAPSLESAQSRFSSAVPQMGTRSGLQRRTYSVAFSGSSTEESFPSLKRFLPDQSHHSGTNYPPTSPVEVPPNKPCTTRREPMCKLITCCCSRAPAAHARPLYPASASFPSVTSLEFPAHAPWPASQPLQHFPVREQTEASQTTRRPRLLPAFKLFSTEKSRSK